MTYSLAPPPRKNRNSSIKISRPPPPVVNPRAHSITAAIVVDENPVLAKFLVASADSSFVPNGLESACARDSPNSSFCFPTRLNNNRIYSSENDASFDSLVFGGPINNLACEIDSTYKSSISNSSSWLSSIPSSSSPPPHRRLSLASARNSFFSSLLWSRFVEGPTTSTNSTVTSIDHSASAKSSLSSSSSSSFFRHVQGGGDDSRKADNRAIKRRRSNLSRFENLYHENGDYDPSEQRPERNLALPERAMLFLNDGIPSERNDSVSCTDSVLHRDLDEEVPRSLSQQSSCGDLSLVIMPRSSSLSTRSLSPLSPLRKQQQPQQLFSSLLRPLQQLQKYASKKNSPRNNGSGKNQKECLLDKNRLDRMRTLVPSQVRVRLNSHLDECWMVQFSPSGEFMASFGLDQTLLIWKDVLTLEPTVVKTLTFRRSLTNIKWSPDSKYIVALLGKDMFHNVTAECELLLLEVETGDIAFSRASPEDLKGNCALGWLADSKQFITARSNNVCFWDIQGRVVESYTLNISCQLAEVIAGRREIIVCTQDDSRLFHVSFYGPVAMEREIGRHSHVHYLHICPSGEFLLASIEGVEYLHQPAAIALYDLRTLKLVRSFEAPETYKNDIFMIKPTFAGPNNEILVAGSENGKIHHWDVASGELLSFVEEHSKMCGFASLHPQYPGLVATCGDDGHIILWTTRKLQNQLALKDEKWLQKNHLDVLPVVNIKKGW